MPQFLTKQLSLTRQVLPTVTVDFTALTVAATADAVYNYTLRSNANGVDTYDLALVSTDVGVSASTDTIAASSILWGGIVLSSGVGTINVPGGSTSGLAVNDTVELTVNTVAGERYTVTNIVAGSAEISGTAETVATITLVPIAPTVTTITAGNVVAGIQVGEYAVTTLTQAAGTESVAGTDGTHTNALTVDTNATTLAGAIVSYTTIAGDSNETITTVSTPAVTILKESRNFSTTTAWVSDGSTVAKPGEVIEYRITVTNTHTTQSATVVFITDDIPAYTAVTPGGYAFAAPAGANPSDVQIDFTDNSAGPATTTVYAIVTGGGALDQAEVAAGTLTATVGSGAADATVPTGGTLDALDSAVVYFRVTVQ
jgi:uncharacterized repeat protein (TIGR01451 family)